jgi:hypothetical protein
MGTKEKVDVACFPFGMTAPACTVLSQLLARGGTQQKEKKPHFQPTPNQLALTLMNINSIWHPCITYGQFHSWDGFTPFTSELPFYEGVDDFTAMILDTVSKEVMDVKQELLRRNPHLDLSAVRHVKDWLMSAYEHIEDTTSLRSCITTNRAYSGLTHPMAPAPGVVMEPVHLRLLLVPDMTHRFWVEDLPYGMVATRGIAELAGVETPVMDMVIQVLDIAKLQLYLTLFFMLQLLLLLLLLLLLYYIGNYNHSIFKNNTVYNIS